MRIKPTSSLLTPADRGQSGIPRNLQLSEINCQYLRIPDREPAGVSSVVIRADSKTELSSCIAAHSADNHILPAGDRKA
jgi:hypothetical protein